MLCEKCNEREATVHVTGSSRVAAPSGVEETFEHHFCESCASNSQLVNPALGYGPDAISEKFRVVSVSPEHIRVRLVRTETEAAPVEWSFLTSRLPPQYAIVGMEFEITCSPEELEQLKGVR